jgi:hypothetical protein
MAPHSPACASVWVLTCRALSPVPHPVAGPFPYVGHCFLVTPWGLLVGWRTSSYSEFCVCAVLGQSWWLICKPGSILPLVCLVLLQCAGMSGSCLCMPPAAAPAANAAAQATTSMPCGSGAVEHWVLLLAAGAQVAGGGPDAPVTLPSAGQWYHRWFGH